MPKFGVPLYPLLCVPKVSDCVSLSLTFIFWEGGCWKHLTGVCEDELSS